MCSPCQERSERVERFSGEVVRAESAGAGTVKEVEANQSCCDRRGIERFVGQCRVGGGGWRNSEVKYGR